MPQSPEFRFHHGSLALSFAGTVGDRASTPIERLGDHHALVRWLKASGLAARGAHLEINRQGFESALALRETIWRIADAIANDRTPSKADVAALNLAAKKWYVVPQLDAKMLATTAASTSLDDALGAIALSAIDTFGREREHLRRCNLDECGAIFLDPGTGRPRKWCTMERCGNRAKVRAFRERA